MNEDEIIFALRSVKNYKASREDTIIAEMIKEAESIVIPMPKHLYNICLQQKLYLKIDDRKETGHA